jgi:hypothetical protein
MWTIYSLFFQWEDQHEGLTCEQFTLYILLEDQHEDLTCEQFTLYFFSGKINMKV